MGQVEGQVTRPGRPLPDVAVVLVNESPESVERAKASGTTDENGRFRIVADDGRPGAAAGSTYRACLIDTRLIPKVNLALPPSVVWNDEGGRGPAENSSTGPSPSRVPVQYRDSVRRCCHRSTSSPDRRCTTSNFPRTEPNYTLLQMNTYTKIAVAFLAACPVAPELLGAPVGIEKPASNASIVTATRYPSEGAIARIGTTRVRPIGGLSDVAWLRDGTQLATLGTKGEISIHRLSDGRKVGNLAMTDDPVAIASSADGTKLIVVTLRELRCWSVKSERFELQWVWFRPDAGGKPKLHSVREVVVAPRGEAVLRIPRDGESTSSTARPASFAAVWRAVLGDRSRSPARASTSRPPCPPTETMRGCTRLNSTDRTHRTYPSNNVAEISLSPDGSRVAWVETTGFESRIRTQETRIDGRAWYVPDRFPRPRRSVLRRRSTPRGALIEPHRVSQFRERRPGEVRRVARVDALERTQARLATGRSPWPRSTGRTFGTFDSPGNFGCLEQNLHAPIRSLAFADDERLAVLAGFSDLRAWNPRTGKVLARWTPDREDSRRCCSTDPQAADGGFRVAGVRTLSESSKLDLLRWELRSPRTLRLDRTRLQARQIRSTFGGRDSIRDPRRLHGIDC